ncbi:hypothetical protein [Candidatus Odyssella thessalonicensis]|uniref:hypothetical protein n=1 Tax=Candidatus Odyssella thessalonicensis TaxID=84647 RepID=UPI000225B4EE|nr:hypothetical protein [Candidatus Odyssella thessalonicensis]
MLNNLRYLWFLSSILILPACAAEDCDSSLPLSASSSLQTLKETLTKLSSADLSPEEALSLYYKNQDISFLWGSLMLENLDLVENILACETLTQRQALIKKELTRRAIIGDPIAQILFIDSYMHNQYGMITTPKNQSILLLHLTNFAQENPHIRHLLVKTFKDGYFGIDPDQESYAQLGKKAALDYYRAPGVADLIIEAMREESLNFRSRDSYIEHYKAPNNHSWVRISPYTDLPFIEELAFEENNKNAQVFLLECYINRKYGADPLNRYEFRQLTSKLETYADENSLLAELIMLVWNLNLLEIKDLSFLEQERLRLQRRFCSQNPAANTTTLSTVPLEDASLDG